MKKKKNQNKIILFSSVLLTALALLILKLLSGHNNSAGTSYIMYQSMYPVILIGEYSLICVFLAPLIFSSANDDELKTHIIPLMLFSALGMMRIDAEKAMMSNNADHSPSVMFLILFASLILMMLSGYSVIGTAGTAAGTVFFPAFGLCFAPVIVAAAFLIKEKNKKQHLISVISNTICCLAAAAYGITKQSITDFAFSKKYVPALILAAALAVVFFIKKDYKLIPFSLLPLFPLTSGILHNSFQTPIFTLCASVAPVVILFGALAVTEKNEKIKGYAKLLSHNPTAFIITAFFILHTAGILFANPGYFRDILQ